MKLSILGLMAGYLLMNVIYFKADYVVLGSLFLLLLWGTGELWRSYGWRVMGTLLVWFLLGCLLLFFRVGYKDMVELDVFSKLPEGEYVLKGRVCKEVDIRRDHINYTLCLEEIVKGGGIVWGKGKVKIKQPSYVVWDYGSELTLRGDLVTPKSFSGFDYQLYLKSLGVGKEFRVKSVINFENNFTPFYWLYKLKGIVLKRIGMIYHEPNSSLIAGLHIGYRGGFAEGTLNDLNRTGLTHLIAISGSNVALVLLCMEKLFFFLSKYKRLLVVLLGLVFFMIFAGLSAAVVRATIMGGLMLGGRYLGKRLEVTSVLMLTMFVFAFTKPMSLVADVGLQLSGLAVLGIVVFYDFWFALLGRWKLLKKISLIHEAVALTLSAQMFVLPLLVIQFGVISLHSPLMNALISPVLLVIILFSAIGFVVAGLWGSELIVLLVDFLCKLFLLIADIGAGMDIFVWEIPLEYRRIVAMVLLVIVYYAAFFLRLRSIRKSSFIASAV